MQRLEVSGAVRPIYGSLGVKRLRFHPKDWHNFLRMHESTYHTLLSMVSPLIQRKNTTMRQAVTPHERLTA